MGDRDRGSLHCGASILMQLKNRYRMTPNEISNIVYSFAAK